MFDHFAFNLSLESQKMTSPLLVKFLVIKFLRGGSHFV